MTAPHAPLPPHTIRAYDIRGLAPEEIDAAAAAHVGRGFASWVRRQGGETVAIGHDARPTSSELYQAAIDGLTSAGVAVTALGLCPTPVVGWAVDQLSSGRWDDRHRQPQPAAPTTASSCWARMPCRCAPTTSRPSPRAARELA